MNGQVPYKDNFLSHDASLRLAHFQLLAVSTSYWLKRKIQEALSITHEFTATTLHIGKPCAGRQVIAGSTCFPRRHPQKATEMTRSHSTLFKSPVQTKFPSAERASRPIFSAMARKWDQVGNVTTCLRTVQFSNGVKNKKKLRPSFRSIPASYSAGLVPRFEPVSNILYLIIQIFHDSAIKFCTLNRKSVNSWLLQARCIEDRVKGRYHTWSASDTTSEFA